MQDKRKSPAADLFGVAPKVQSSGEHKVDQKKATSPLDEDDCVIRVFCKGCGKYLPIVKEGADALAKECGADLADDLSGSYFESEKCVFCSEEREFKGVVLKNI